MTQRGTLTPADQQALHDAKTAHQAATDDYINLVLEMVEKSSYREVARVTGLSTNTLQRWKREHE